MKVAVVINGKSGPEGTDQDIDTLRALFAAHNIEAEIHAVDGEQIVETAQSAVDSGVDAVVAGGGDGTVSAVAGVLVDTGVPFGVLPLGTLNHFAKDAGIPLTVEEAVRVIATGEVQPLDVGEVNGRVFVNNSSVGLYPAVVKIRDEAREQHGIGKWSAMAAAMARVLRRFPLLRVRIEAGGETVTRTTPFVFIGNNEYQMSLFTLGTRSCLNDGKLCAYYAGCASRYCIVRMAFRALFGRLAQDRDFQSMSGREVWIEHRRPGLYVSTDGEVVRLEPPLHYRIRPGALKVILPRREKAEG